MALNFRKRSNVWARLDARVVDGRITTAPPDSVSYDRRLDSLVAVGAEGFFANRFDLRVNVTGEGTRRRVMGEEEQSPVMDETIGRYKPSADLTFITDKGLELFGGGIAHIHQARVRTDETSAGKTTTRYQSATVLARRFGVVRRAGRWSGGFAYVQGAEEDQALAVTAFDGSVLETTERVFIPSRVSVFGEFSLGAPTFDFDLALVQARGVGPKDDRGTGIYTDHFEAKVGAFVPLGGDFGLDAEIGHRTLSYARNAYMTLETIPVTTYGLSMAFGKAEAHSHLGITGLTGRDGQSLPEFNARYEVIGFGMTMGFFAPL